VAFIGPSGAGKSTLIDIIANLIMPDAGTFSVDGKTISSMKSLQHLISYVPQAPALLDETIAQNVAFAEEKPDTDLIHQVLEWAHLGEFVRTLPDGIYSAIGENGVKLSGGQKQRLAIARALYRNPEILLFDEATSALDTLSETAIAEAIRAMKGKKTIVAIAHRLSTIKNFDIIYVMDQGKIISRGSHQALMLTCPLYQKLYDLQEKVFVNNEKTELAEV
jgi:ABC-type multidrug transport system fused ATPase/permease subunit